MRPKNSSSKAYDLASQSQAGPSGNLFGLIAERAPRIHCLTNSVARAFTANAVLAVGGLPSMTYDVEEVAAFVASADALLVNLGTVDDDMRASIPIAIAAARDKNLPWLLDPVFCDRSQRRAEFALECMRLDPPIVKVNQSEAAAVTSGLDAVNSAGGVVVTTGPVDLIRIGDHSEEIYGGHALMRQVTAMGCALGSIMSAAMVVNADHFAAAKFTIQGFSAAGERAGENSDGPGSFLPLFLDELAKLKSFKAERDDF